MRPRTEAETQQLAQLPAQDAEVAAAIDLAEDFATLLRQRHPAQLDSWLARAAQSPIEALQRFAAGLQEDYAAVKAGVTLPWSTSPVAGHINRLKMLKRQMCGRAHLDLLRRRFLRLADQERSPSLAHTSARGPPSRCPERKHHDYRDSVGHRPWQERGFVRLRACAGLVLRQKLSTGRALGAGVKHLVFFSPVCPVVSSAFTKSGHEPN